MFPVVSGVHSGDWRKLPGERSVVVSPLGSVGGQVHSNEWD